MIGPMDIYVDLFAGGGGTSCGFEAAMGFSPDIAVNHSPEAIAMHAANHPRTKHYITDVWDIDPAEVCGGRPVGMLWASPDCTHFSRAKGSAPKSKKIRSLAWIVIRWAKEVRPKVIFIENVSEFRSWGPLDENGQPIKTLAGETFETFLNALRELGYIVEHKELRACDYGAPTIRKRFFLIARCDGDPIVWPEKTHGPETGTPYHTAAECIDWTIPCPSIFSREKPLAENTMKRIAKGVIKYVLQNPQPFLINASCCNHICRDSMVSAFLSQYHGEQSGKEVRGQAISEPLMVIDSSNRYGLCACTLMRQFGTSSAAPIDEPMGTVMPEGSGKTGLICAFLDKYYGNEKNECSLSALMPTATVHINGKNYVITDIGMRMLQPRELYRAQGFPEDYKIDIKHKGKLLPKSAQVKMCGNSVCPPVAAAIISSNCINIAKQEVA